MEITDRHIVAIDLGTSKLALTVAKVTGRDVQIVYYKENAAAGIRYSSVFHVTQAADAIIKAVKEAEDALGIKITQAVVGMPKYPVRQESNIHLNTRGEYLQAAVWYGAIYGVDPRTVDCKHPVIDDEDAAFLRECAYEALKAEGLLP